VCWHELLPRAPEGKEEASGSAPDRVASWDAIGAGTLEFSKEAADFSASIGWLGLKLEEIGCG
jgi:hypothetical protein